MFAYNFEQYGVEVTLYCQYNSNFVWLSLKSVRIYKVLSSSAVYHAKIVYLN